MSRISLGFRKSTGIYDSDQAIVDDISNFNSNKGLERNENERHNGFDCKPSVAQISVALYFVLTVF